MKKIVLKLGLNDDKEKQKAMKAVSSLKGLNSITMDMKEKKLTVIGEVDPVDVVEKLRKSWHTEIISVGPEKEEKKKEEPKKQEEKVKSQNEQMADLLKAYKDFDPRHTTFYYVQRAEENPNNCVIS